MTRKPYEQTWKDLQRKPGRPWLAFVALLVMVIAWGAVILLAS